MRSRFSRSARETAWSIALGGLGSCGMRILTGFRGEIARFVILKARCQRVNHLHVPLCPEVQLRLVGSRHRLIAMKTAARHKLWLVRKICNCALYHSPQ